MRIGKAKRRAGDGPRCCKNPNLPAAPVPGFCDLKFCEDPELLIKRRKRQRRESVERVRI